MNKNRSTLLVTMIIICMSMVQHISAQDNWSSWSRAISVSDYQGHRFKMQGQIRAELEDDSASAMMWARVDRKKGAGFFDNMGNRPIRNKEWKTYNIEGTIDTGATTLTFGVLTFLNGKFYYDNFKVELEKMPGKWETIYSTDFEKGIGGWEEGVNMPGYEGGKNPLFNASLQTDLLSKSKVLLVEGKNITNYGFNKKTGKFADVNGIKLYYEIYGDGPPLVVLHGNGGSISSAATHYPDLIKKYKVIAIDSRAQGRSGDTDQPLTYDQMASDVNVLLDQLNIDSAFIWGQSDGAILCLQLAIDYPKKVKRVVAFAPNIQPDSSAVQGWAVTWVNNTIKASADKKQVKLFTMMRDYPNVPYSKLNTIKAPCLIMGGDRDVIRLEHLVKMFQNIPNSQLCILPGSTHGGAWEKKDQFMQIMNDFFNKPFMMPDTKDWLN
ncbi:MAG TPA: alpha/beta hydrolase [Ferruginibacter sp.]|nr:alpha/beta hydrolase [Ferruginibacter sp.]